MSDVPVIFWISQVKFIYIAHFKAGRVDQSAVQFIMKGITVASEMTSVRKGVLMLVLGERANQLRELKSARYRIS